MDVTDVLGGYGPWQRTVLLVTIYRAIPLAFVSTVPLFYVATTDHWCSRPDGLNWTLDQWLDSAIPRENGVRNRCHRYRVTLDGSGDALVDTNQTLPCSAWEYEEKYGNTIFKEFNLVCGDSWMLALTHTAIKIGNLVAFLPGGYMTDKLGRKTMSMCGVGLSLVSNTVAAFSPTYTFYLLTRVFTGIFYGVIVTSSLCLLVEILGPEHRHKVSYSFIGGWGLAIMIIPGVYWLSQEWRQMQLITTVPFTVIFLAALWWFVPESTRWLLTTNRDKRAKKIILDGAKKNHVHITDIEATMKELKKKIQDESGNVESTSILDLFKTRHMKKCSAVLLSTYFICAFVYFGFTLTVEALGASLYLTIFLMGVTELAAVVIFTPIVLYGKRRISLVILNMLSSAGYLAAIPVPQDMLWLRLVLAMSGRLTSICAGNLMWMTSAEIFPTTHRSVGINGCMTAGRVGTIFATFLVGLAQESNGSLLLIVYGVLLGLGGLLFLLLPETKGKHLPDTLRASNNLSQKTIKKPDQKEEDDTDTAP